MQSKYIDLGVNVTAIEIGATHRFFVDHEDTVTLVLSIFTLDGVVLQVASYTLHKYNILFEQFLCQS